MAVLDGVKVMYGIWGYHLKWSSSSFVFVIVISPST